MNSEKRMARITGILYLVIFIANMSVAFLISPSLNDPGNAAATANNIMASEGLFRMGIVGYLFVFLSDLGVAVLLYSLLKSVNQPLALVAMIARLLQTAVHGVNLINYFFPLLLLSGADYLTVFEPAQLDALVLLFLNVHHYGVLISEAFFALALLVGGYLVYKSELFPNIFGIFMVIAGVGYVMDSFGIFLLPNAEAIIAQIMFVMAVLGELPFTLWLLIKGVKDPQPESGSTLVAEGASA